MLQNAYFLAEDGADTAENEQHFAEILPIGRRVADRCPLSTARLVTAGKSEPVRANLGGRRANHRSRRAAGTARVKLMRGSQKLTWIDGSALMSTRSPLI